MFLARQRGLEEGAAPPTGLDPTDSPHIPLPEQRKTRRLFTRLRVLSFQIDLDQVPSTGLPLPLRFHQRPGTAQWEPPAAHPQGRVIHAVIEDHFVCIGVPLFDTTRFV